MEKIIDEEDTKGGVCSKCGAWKGGDYGIDGNGKRSYHICLKAQSNNNIEQLDETEKCWLEFVEGYLTCTHNHTLGALCLGLKCPYCHELKCKCYE
jgi:hypothetical protein